MTIPAEFAQSIWGLVVDVAKAFGAVTVCVCCVFLLGAWNGFREERRARRYWTDPENFRGRNG